MRTTERCVDLFGAWGKGIWKRDFGIETLGGNEIKSNECVRRCKINLPNRQNIFPYASDARRGKCSGKRFC